MTAPIPGASASASPSTPALLRAATAADLPAVQQLLATAALPLDGIDDFFPAGYVVATGQDGALVGVAGLETYGREGFLRSVAVIPNVRGRGVGSALVQDRLATAQAAGLTGVHLLTENAAGFFARFGFAPSARATLPPEVQRSVLFARACPETAAAMSLPLSYGTLATRDEDIGERRSPLQSEPSRTMPARAPRLMGAIAILSLLTASSAAESAPGDMERVRDAARAGTHAMAIADHLANRIGPRLTGSDRLIQACAWAQEELASYGLTNVRREEAGSIPVGFNRGPASGRMVEPETVALHFGTPAWSAGTSGLVRGPARRLAQPLGPPEGPAGPVPHAANVAGAWVLLPESQIADPQRYATLLTELTRQYAAGVLLSSPAEWIPAGGDPAISWNALPSLPVILLRASEWAEIDRLVHAQTPVVLEFDIRHDFLPGPRPLHNVLGEIRGTELPEEVVLVGAHLDSWDAGTGATDNAAGCATTMAAARLLQTAAVAPRRTIRFVLFTGEEQGLIGSTSYTERHAGALALHSAVLVQDRGANPITGIEAPPRLAAELEQVLEPLRDMKENRPFAIRSTPVQGRPSPTSCQASCTPQAKASCSPAPSSAGRTCAPNAGCAAGTGCSPNAASASAASGKGGGCGAAGALCPSDHWPFLAAGVPAFLWLQDGPLADERHHTSLDTFDGIRGDDLEHSARLVALAALAIADHDRSLPRDEIQPTRATP